MENIKLVFFLFLVLISQLSINIFFHQIYPNLLELIFWFIVLYYKEQKFIIFLLLIILETLSLSPVVGFYFLSFLLVKSFLVLGDNFFYIDGVVFRFFYLFLIYISEMVILFYFSVMGVFNFSNSVFIFLLYSVIQIIMGIIVFYYSDIFFKRTKIARLV